MSWLNAAFQVAVPVLTGRAQGQVQGQLLTRQLQHEDEDRQAATEQRRVQLAQAALQQQLLQAQLAHAQAEELRAAHPRTPWEQQGFGSQDEQLGYLEALNRSQHPERYQRPEQSTLTPWGKEGFSDEQSYLRYLGRAARAEHPERYERPTAAGADLPFDPRDPKNHQKFLTAYLMRTNQGHADPKSLEWIPPAPAEQRMKDAEAAYQEMARLTDPNYVPPGDEFAPAPAEAPDRFTLPGLLEQVFGSDQQAASAPASAQPSSDSLRHSVQPAIVALTAAPDSAPTVHSPPRVPGSSPNPFSATRQAADMIVRYRIGQFRRQGVSKEQGYQILRQEGLIDEAGNVIADPDGAP